MSDFTKDQVLRATVGTIVELTVARARKEVKVCCDEAHAHTAERGCFDADAKDLTIVVLADRLEHCKSVIDALVIQLNVLKGKL